MALFLRRLSVFFAVIILLIIIGLFLPPTPKSRYSQLFSEIKKDSLLVNVPAPRLILIGGSNITFGLNSRLIKDSLKLNPVNAGIQMSVGALYMLDNALNYIKPGDVVILALEYSQYYGRAAYGEEALLKTLLDIPSDNKRTLRKQQLFNIIEYVPKYSFSKFNPDEYIFDRSEGIYTVNAFNEYGDADIHWNLSPRKIIPSGPENRKLNDDLLEEFSRFNDKLNKLGASFFITFPCFQASSYDNSRVQIEELYRKLNERSLRLLGTPERYRMADSLVFDSPYHLTKQGVDLRTRLLIGDMIDNGIPDLIYTTGITGSI